ncbi:MAG: YadA-like family protein, partial [Alphaproteobacteria bacterium]|nr:YadA-like family protein [Alphaproteobacteria bacterium]
TTGTANYVEENAENATYTGTQVNVAPGSVAPEATIKSALSAASEQIDINTAAISSIQDNITVANPGATPYNVISEGANVAGNLVALDAAAGTAATINTNQNETLNALAGLIDGGSVNANGVRTAGTELSDNFTADNLVGAANELLGNITVEANGNYIEAGADVAGNLSALDTQVKANADAIGSQTTKIESIGEAIGGSFDDDGNFERASYGNPLYNISDDDTIVEAIGNLDSAIGNREISSANAQINTATGSSVAAGLKAAGDVIGLAQSAKATEGLLKNYAITGDSTVEGATSIISALNTIATTAAGLALNNTFTGTNTFGSEEGEQVIISSNGNLTVDGDLTIGEANAIRSSGAGVLDMNHNSLTNVQGLTLVDANNNTATLSLNGTTIETGNKNIDVGTGSLNGQSLNIGSADQFTVDSSGNVSTTGTASFGATTVTSLDAGSGTIKTTGAIEGGTLDISGNAEIGGALDVTGNTTIGGTLDVTGALSGSTATFTGLVTSEGLNAGSGDITTTGNLSAGAATVTSLDAGSGLITTTGTVHGSTIEAGSHTSLTEGRLVVSDGTKTSSLEKDKLTLDGIEMTKNDDGKLNIASGLNVVGDETISGTLTIGEANAITGTEDTLDMGANALTNVNGLTLTDGAAEPSTITMAVQSVSAKQYGEEDFASHTVLGINQDTFVDGLIGSTNGLSVFKSTGAQYEEVFSVDDTGSILSDMLKTDNGEGNSVTLGKDESSKTILNGSMQFGTEEETPYVNAIDDGSEAQTEGGANTMATVATVLASAENAAYTEVGPNITEATTIKNAIHTLDTKMGAVADVAVNGYETEDASARTLTGAVSALNTNMQNVLGSVYKADGSYDATQLVGNGLEAESESLTDAVTEYAANVQAAMGTTFAEDGSFVNGYAKAETPDYDGLDTSLNLVEAISQLDGNIGTAIEGVEREGVEGASTSATNTVNANIQALDTAIGNLNYTGGELDYANETGSVTDAIKTINANIGAAIAADDIADRTVGRIASDNTVNQNLVALDTAIGADVTVLYNGVSVENAVNGNIDALNTIIGNVSTLEGNALQNGTEDKPATVVEALQNINDTLGVIHGLVESEDAVKTTTDVDYYGNLAVGDATVEAHLEALDASIGDRRVLESLNEAINQGAKESVAVALEAAGNAIGDADFSQTHYASSVRDASSAIRVIDSNLYRLDNEVKDLRKNMKRGFASMAAMSAMVPNARAKGNTQLSFGTGMYSGHTGFALGGFHWFTDNLLMNIGVAYGDGDSSDMIYRAGVTYSW